MRIIFSFLVLCFCTASSIAYAEDPLIEAYSVEPHVQGAALSPDGKLLALALAENDDQIVKIVNLDDLAFTNVVSVDFAFPRSVRQDVLWLRWASNEVLLVNVKAIGPGAKDRILETSQLISINADGKIIKDLGKLSGVSLKGGTEQFQRYGILSLLPDEPEHILMGIRGHAASKLNIMTGQATLIRRGSRELQYFTPDLRGEIRVAQGLEFKDNKFHLKVRDTDHDEWRDYKTYPGLKADERIVGFNDNPDEMIVARYGGNDTFEFQIYDLKQKRITKTLFSDPTYDAQSLVYNGQLNNIIGVAYTTNAPQTRFFDSEVASNFENLASLFSDDNISILSNDSQMNKFVVRASSGSKPGSVYILNSSTRETKLISYDYPSLDEEYQGTVQAVQYAASDGQNIPSYVTLPDGISSISNARNLPFIVMPHGGPNARDYAEFDWLAQYLTAKGYGVLQMNFRGSSGYGKAFLEQGQNDWSLMRRDVDDGAKWLISNGYANPKEICILGWSFGGYLAQMAASDSDVGYACAASINGVSDWQGRTRGKNDDIWGSPENYKTEVKNSPISKAADVKIPIFIGHAELDTVVRFRNSRRYASELKKKKKDHIFISFPAADHGIEDIENRSRLLSELTDFFEKNMERD